MRRHYWYGLAALMAVPLPAAAQNMAVITAQPNRYEQPSCDGFRGGHFKVKSGATYVQSALNSPDNRDRIMGDARRVLLEAITNDRQETSAVAWYWLGRVYLYHGDVVGADSALDRAERLAPECRGDLEEIRFNTYVALLRPAVEFLQNGQSDSAFTMLLQARAFYQGAPHAYRYLGVIYYNRRQLDSAAINFEQAIATVEMPRDSVLREQTMFNLAAAYQNLGRYGDAIGAWRRYLAWVPSDTDAKKALAAAFRASNMPDSAQAIEAELVAGGEGVSDDEILNIGVNAFRDGRYDDAAVMFRRVLSRNPYHHRALVNLANTYAQTENADSLVATSLRIMALDPMNENTLRLLARGYQIKQDNENTPKYVLMMLALPVNVEVAAFAVTDQGAEASGAVVGRNAVDATDRKIAPAAMTVVFEFLDKDGGVVGAPVEVAVPPLAADARHEFQIQAQGAGIVGWRYRKK